MQRFRLSVLGCLVACASFAVGQDNPAITVSMNDQANFVLSGNGFSTFGIQFFSPSGSLNPAPMGVDGEIDASPFSFSLSNTISDVTLGTLPPAVVLDGDVTLTAGWNPLGRRDVGYYYGLGETAVGPFFIAEDSFRGECVDCVEPPLLPIQVDFDDDFQFTLTGHGHQLTSFQFGSESGSLLPATTPAPFSSTTTNTPNLIQFAQEGTAVELDGTVTLGAGWNDFVGGRDLTYQYNLAEGQVGEGGPFNVRSRVYPPQIDWPRLLFSFDDNDRFVINGAGQPLTEMALQSASGSLIPDNANPGPFVSVSGDASQVVYSSPNAAVVVDGTLTLGVGWATGAPDGRRDARYTYDLAGDTREYGPYQVSSREYPREISWPRLTASLDENDFIVLSGGSGHPLNQVDVSSRSGSLRTSDAVGPFSSIGTNSESLVEYVADSPLILEGQLTLGTAWARGGDQDVRVEYDLDRVASNTTITPPRSEYPICFTGDQGNAVGVFIDRQNRFVLRGEGHQLESLQLSSDGGALVPGESAAPFSAFGSNTPELVQFVAENGNVAIEGLVVLSTEWNEELGIKDVRIDLGNIQQPSNVYSGCFTPGLGQGSHDSGGELVGLIESDGRVSLYSVGGVVAADMIELTSDSGNLVPAGDAGPFDSLVSNNAFQVIFASDSSEVLIDGSLSLDVRINDANNNDIAAIWQHNGGNPVAFAIGRSAEVVPEPSSAWLFWASLLGLTFTRRSRSTETHRTRIEKATPTMQTSRTLLAVACLLCIQTQHVLAQDDPKFSLFLDEASKFVIASDGERTSGFDIKSASGSLVPVGDGSLQAPAVPFAFLLANNQNQITWGNLGSTVMIDGLLTLDAGWNQAGTQDVVYSYSDGPNSVGPITMPVGNYTECTDCPLPPPQFSLSDDNQIEITAFGQELLELRITSPSSSLVPGDSPAPFQSFASNTTRSINFEAPDKVTIDGTVALSSGWNQRVGGRDLRFWYSFEEVDNGGVGDGQGVSGAINSEGFMVVSGSGQQLSGLEFQSNTSSLIPIPPGTLQAPAAPFAFLLANRPDHIVFGNLGSSVTLQGDLVTQVGFSGVDAGQEIQASWGKGATPVRFPINGIISDGEDPGNSPNSVLRGPFLLPAQEYPPQVNWPRIGVTLNDDNQFVIEGSGHPINQFEFNSRNASLVPSAEAGPFASVVEATERRVTYEAAENSEVILEGSVTLGTAWNDKAAKDVRYSYDLIGDTRNYSFSVDQREYPVVPVCFDGAVARLGVFIDLSDRINLTGNGQQLSELSLSSAGGALIPGESAAPFARFDSNTSQLISMVADAGPVTVSGVVTLSASWDSASGIQDLHANFGDQQLPESVYPRCVNPDDPTFPGGNPGDGDGFFAVVGADDRITLFNEGQIQIGGIDLISNAGLLVPVPDDDPSPFSFFLSNTNNQITYGNLGTTVTVNGALTLSARYLGQFPEGDLFATWGNGATPVAFPVTRSGPVVPEPSTIWMLLPVFFTATMLRRRRR